MKIVILFAAVLAVTAVQGFNSDRRPPFDNHVSPPYVNRPHPPTDNDHRVRRAPEPQGSIHAHGTQHTTGRDPQKQWNIDYEHKVWGNEHGSINVNAGAQKVPGHHTEGHAGISGSIHW